MFFLICDLPGHLSRSGLVIGLFLSGGSGGLWDRWWDHYCGEVTDRNVGRSASAEGGAAAVFEVPGEKLIRDSSRCVLVPYVRLVEVENWIKVLSWQTRNLI